MRFFADLHVHSKFSRATSAGCDLERLALWAQHKGLGVVGTGDFTHPAWLAEIKDKLVPAEPGLFCLKPDLEKNVAERVLPSCRQPVRFILQVEVSTIYKKKDKTRKVHHLILVPDLAQAERIAQRLSRIGNIAADGRPILGLDSRALLEIVLEAGAGAYLIPAHIWTPWFSALGAHSGFDSIDECYADLAPHIFALETGLSSDPAMNWRLSGLDRFRLVSNSDAHSPAKLGREACVFNTALDFFTMRQALATGAGYMGTIEFFPEEGKYHLDGHRQCGVRLAPEETRRNSGLCPVCRKPVTVGVMNRVLELADRPEGARPANPPTFSCFVPLKEILSEILRAGPESKTVLKSYEGLIARLGPELFILEQAPLDDFRRVGTRALAEAMQRMRANRVIREAGYDGEYGVIKLFQPGELEKFAERSLVFGFMGTASPPRPDPPAPEKITIQSSRLAADGSAGTPRPAAAETFNLEPGSMNPALQHLDPEQQAAAEITEGPLLIIAGPGAGKTRTLTQRIARLISDHGVPPGQCLAITFTRRAAGEMQERLRQLVPAEAAAIPVMTFHALGHLLLKEQPDQAGLPVKFRAAGEEERTQLLMESLKISARKAERLLAQISKYKRNPAPAGADAELAGALAVYEPEMRRRALVDFDDLIARPANMLATCPALGEFYRRRYQWISVDEYQDIDPAQYRLLKLLAPAAGNLCVIGDPDQSIYGFRGAELAIFNRFPQDFPGARIVQLNRNYRSGKMIVQASQQLMTPASLVKGRRMLPRSDDATKIGMHESATELAEAEFVAHTIEQTIGGATFFAMDSGRVTAGPARPYSFADFAVLCRTEAQMEPLRAALARSGLPFRQRSHRGLADSPLARKIAELLRIRRNLKQTAARKKTWSHFIKCDQGPALAPEPLPLSAGPDLSALQYLEKAVTELEEKNRAEALMLTKALRPLAERCEEIEDFLSALAIGVEADIWDPRADCISLLTLHASKGLEFPVVFITGCEDGLIPLRWGGAEDCNLDEERRLFFVGMTRARERLFLCRAKRRRRLGALKELPPSPFLRDIAEQLLERSRAVGRKKKSAGAQQLALF